MAEADDAGETPTHIHLLVGTDSTVVRQHLRAGVTLALGQAVFTTSLWIGVERYGLAERPLVAFALTLVLIGVGLAVGNGFRGGGLLLSVGLVLAPLVGAVPVTYLRAGAVGESLQATVFMIGGLGVWAGILGFIVGVGLRWLWNRVVGQPEPPQ